MKIDDAKLRPHSLKLEEKKTTSLSSSPLSIFTENKKGEYYYITLKNLIPFKKQARVDFDDKSINTLAETISLHGIRQPLTVVKSIIEKDKFEIVSGERRYLAAKLLGMDKVPCIILQNYEDAEEIALIENVQRQDLHPLELGLAYKSLYDSGRYKTKANIAEKLGVPRTQVIEYMNFIDMPLHIRESLMALNIRERAILRKISNMNDIHMQEEFIKNLKTEKSESELNQDKRLNKNKVSLGSFYVANGTLKLKGFDTKKLSTSHKIQLKTMLLELLKELET